MKTLLVSALAFGAMTSVTLAAPPPAKPTTAQPGPVALSDAQMDKLTAGVCIGNCPGNKTQVGVNACVITRNCQPKNQQKHSWSGGKRPPTTCGCRRSAEGLMALRRGRAKLAQAGATDERPRLLSAVEA